MVFLAFLGTTPRTAIIRDAFVLALRRRRDLWQYTDLLFNYCCKYPDSRTGIIKFSDYLQTKGIKLLFVVLKMDSLNQQELDDFRRMSSGHILCFTADGNSALRENLEIQVAGGYKDVVCINLNGGLEEVSICSDV